MAGNRINVTLTLDTSAFERAVNRTTRNLEAFQRRLETIGTNLTQSISLPLAALGGASVRAFGEFEALEKAFQAVAAEGTNVGQEIEKLRKIAEAPGLGFNEAVKASTRLQAVGLSAGEAARVIEQYGNAVARSGGGAVEFDGAILALTQVASKGKISAEEINQLNERIFEIRPALKAAFGTADSEALQKLGISAEEFIARTTEELAKLERVNSGLANAFENFRDTARAALSDIGREIATAINLGSVLDRLSSALGTAATFFRNLSPEAKRTAVTIGLVAIAAGPVLIAVAKLTSLFTLALQGAKALVGGVKSIVAAFAFLVTPVGLVVAGITALVGALIFLYNRFELVRKVANGLIDGFKALGTLAKTVAGNIAQGFVDLFRGNFRDSLEAFKDAFTKSSAVSVGKAFSEGFGDGFQDGSNRLNNAIDGIRNKLKALATPQGGPGGATGTQAFNLSDFERATAGGARGRAADPAAQFREQVETIRRQIPDLERLDGPLTVRPPIVPTLEVAEVEVLGGKIREAFSRTLTEQAQGDVLGLNAAFDQARNAAETFKATIEDFQAPSQSIQALGDAVQAAGNAFADLATQGETSFRKLGQAAVSAARATISAFIREGVAGIVKNILSGPTGKALGPLALGVAAAAGGGAAALFNTLLNRISPPRLASGGLAYSETLAVVGDNRNARVDPEVIAPLSKLKNLIGGGSGYVAEARISGDDLLLLVSRADERLNLLR